ncbi:periplasmic binding protein-like II [Piromyces finnis]|uniref:Periplasmic binding protein-like II n=1 Tax=Piromyces finnis TaxID=1754191 RepID=A0A1Y1UZS4_9FUNG|nr:periplasmic binding protein-like II [Piromyces finnis]|eukprot:ORX44204.1 periplasmic binding protein-like II [Piromyces finnis]
MFSNFILILLLFALYKGINGIDINVLAFTRDGNDSQMYTPSVNAFNKYSKENNLNIKLNLTLLTAANITYSKADYGALVESLLKRNSKKYELYFYDNIYIQKYAEYFQDLRGLISEDIINEYDPQIINESCIYNNKLVGMPVRVGFSVLYSNNHLLNKYNKNVPKTWEELIDTGKYILEEEKKLNNTNILGYNGLFPDSEEGTTSLYEFIYSFRSNSSASFPYIRSKEVVNALKMLKRIKNDLASDEEFRLGDPETVTRLFDGTAIFIRFWIFLKPTINLINYKVSSIPGGNEGVTSAILTGYNLGIIKDIEKEKQDAAIKVIEFIASKNYQKQLVKKNYICTAIPSLYYDDEICTDDIDCELYNNFQPIGRPKNKLYDYDEYSEKFRNNIYEYLFGNKTVEEVLENVDDITKIHYISLDTNESYIGIIEVIIVVIVIIVMVCSLVFTLMENYRPFFEYLSIDFWGYVVLGSILFLSACFTKVGMLTQTKCYLNLILIIYGFTFTYIPILYKLIVKIPDDIKFSYIVKKRKYQFFLLFLLIDTILCGLLIAKPYTIETLLIDAGENFQICRIIFYHMIIMIIVMVYKCIVILIMLLLIFIQWNIKATILDTRLTLATIYIDILLLIISIVLNFANINDYFLYNLMHQIITFLIALSNYSFLYGFKLIRAAFKKKNVKLMFINNINKEFVDDEEIKKEFTIETTNPSIIGTRDIDSDEQRTISHKSSVITRIINYHYTIDTNSNDDALIESASEYKTMNQQINL